jgi:indoleamine 2,3-dioxygenase
MAVSDHAALNLAAFNVTAERGFLPPEDPLGCLPRKEYGAWEDLSVELPKLLAAGVVRRTLDRLPMLDPTPLFDHSSSVERAMLLLSYFGHAYVWGEAKFADVIPEPVAVPWHALAHRLGRPPVLSYASYALRNWRRLDQASPIALGNLALLQNFLGGVDEEWFILVHVEIEAKAGRGMQSLMDAQTAVAQSDREGAVISLTRLEEVLESMLASLARMPERCDPYIYYRRVRPYIHGWRDHPALPNGVLYAGVREYSGQRQQFRGETGAQSSIIPCLDAGLGIQHPESPLAVYLREMRDYMPTGHRAFIGAVKRGPSIRSFASAGDSEVREAYNKCLLALERFRGLHMHYASTYIQQQHERGSANPTDVGTGGTPFMGYLEEHRQTTLRHLLSG